MDESMSAVAREQAKLQEIFDNAPAAMAILRGPNLIVEMWNPSYNQLFENRIHRGKPFLETLPELHGQPYARLLHEVLETGVPYREIEAEAHLRRSNSAPLETRYFDQSYMRIGGDDGLPFGVFIHAVEVTDRVQAKRRLEEAQERAIREQLKLAAAFEAVRDGIFVFSEDGTPVYMNAGAAHVFGESKASAVTRNIEWFFDKVDLFELDGRLIPHAEWPLFRSLSGVPYNDWVMRARRRDTKQEWYWSVSGARATQGSGLNIGISVIEDITEKRAATQALEASTKLLEAAKAEAEAANEAKSQFLANMSHEIRTPMTAVLGFTEILTDPDVSASDRHDAIARIQSAGRSLLRLIEDVLDLSKIEAGAFSIQSIPINPQGVAQEVIDVLRLSADRKSLQLTLDCDPAVPYQAFTDPARLRQILTNLLGNAIKFTARGEVKLRISADAQALQLKYEVQDTGIGVADPTRLFRPFSQADASITRSYGGSGLGLMLSRRLAERMGGTLELKTTTLGQGSIFELDIPAGPFTYHRPQRELANITPPHPVITSQTLNAARILVVEDVEDNQVLMALYLESAGAKVWRAYNGQEAVEIYCNNPNGFDLILMDIQMPVMDGIQATKILRAQGAKLPILALTAHAMKEEYKRSLDAGCDTHLTKPIRKSQLIQAIKEYL